MKIIDLLKHNKGTLIKFVEFHQEKNINSILASDIHTEMIMYYLSFLESQQVYVLVDHQGYAVYKQFDKSNQVIINCEFIDKSIIHKYVLGIVQAFNYLETPF